jgi:glycosyltransferase involved in cell wall biosynthesis
VNDGIAGALEVEGLAVERIAPRAAASPLPVVGVAQHWPPRFEAPSEGPFVLYQPWEVSRVPEAWLEPIRRRVDEVWTPSAAARQAYVDSGVAPELVHVMPNGVDLDRFAPGGAALELPTRKGTVFLFVGGRIHRKGIDLLFEAFSRAFTAVDDVCLAVKSFGAKTLYHDTADLLVERFRARPDSPELVLLDDELPFDAIPALYRAAHVLVQPYRGEGFCLPALEALACGVPPIVTAGGPTDDFVTDLCGWRVASRPCPLPEGALPPDYALAGDGMLLEPELDELVAALREAADPAVRAAKAARARAHAEPFSWEAAGRVAARRLEALAGREPIRHAIPAAVPNRRRLLFAVLPDWERPETWAPPLVAYARAFAPGDEATLALPTPDEAAAVDLVTAELEAAGVDLSTLPDVALATAESGDTLGLELAADAVICAAGPRPTRARRVLASDPAALRALLHAA